MSKGRPKNRTAKWSCKSELKLRQMLEQTAEIQECHFYLYLIIPFSQFFLSKNYLKDMYKSGEKKEIKK